jgi:competence protein ComEC
MQRIIIAISIVLSLFINDYQPQNLLQIYFIDVGQGDSILIISPDQKMLLVDTGKDFAAAQALQRILPLNINAIDYVIITHDDYDHIGGLDEIQALYRIDSLIIDDAPDDFVLGCCVIIDIVWPEQPYIRNDKDNNSNSIAFFLEYKEFRAFFGGDLGIAQENTIILKHPERQINLLKVGHHGSKNSTSKYFLSQLQPEYGVISAGRKNRFGHPHKEVLANLAEYNVNILRTDQIGHILFQSDGFTFNYRVALLE